GGGAGAGRGRGPRPRGGGTAGRPRGAGPPGPGPGWGGGGGPGGYGASVPERAGRRARGPASPEQRTWHARRSSERLGFVARTHRESSGTGHTRICRSLGRGRRAGFGESGYSLGDDQGRARS